MSYPSSYAKHYVTGHIGALSSDVAAGTDLSNVVLTDETVREKSIVWTSGGTRPGADTIGSAGVSEWRIVPSTTTRFSESIAGVIAGYASNTFDELAALSMGFLTYGGAAAALVGTLLEDAGTEIAIGGGKMIASGAYVGQKITAWNAMLNYIENSLTETVGLEDFRQLLPRYIERTVGQDAEATSIEFLATNTDSWVKTLQDAGYYYLRSVVQKIGHSPTGEADPSQGWEVTLDIACLKRYTTETAWNGSTIESIMYGSANTSDALAAGHNVITYDGVAILSKRTVGGVARWFPVNLTGTSRLAG
jgi:hypothetical protein